MTHRRFALAGAVLLAATVGASSPAVFRANGDLPDRLTARGFWDLVAGLSEPDGYFRSDNLVSNEEGFQTVVPDLVGRVGTGGVYLGVGPDQNFTYIAALRPRAAFITDIRRGNLHLHLLYKALFELAADRAGFLSLLFSRPRPPGLDREATAAALFGAFAGVEPSRPLYERTLEAVTDRLTRQHGFALAPGDLAGLDYVFSAFYQAGPSLSYSSGAGRGRGFRYPTFQALQLATDGRGELHGYLSSDARFQVVRDLQLRHLIVPVVGDFAGPRALRAIGGYLRAHGAAVTVFYTSNVEQYLFQDAVWPAFARNLAALPLDERATLVRACFNNCASPQGTRSVTLLDSIPGLLAAFADGRAQSYRQVLGRSR